MVLPVSINTAVSSLVLLNSASYNIYDLKSVGMNGSKIYCPAIIFKTPLLRDHPNKANDPDGYGYNFHAV